MKKFILIALAFAGLTATAGSFGLKPIVSQPSCYNGSNGLVSAVVVGGQSPYTYHWSTGSTATSLTSVPSGSYTLTVTDALGQTAIMTASINAPAKLTVATSATNVSQSGGSNGCVHLSVNGGTPGYDYHWSNSASGADQCGLAAGTYKVTVTDALGCTSIASKTIFQPTIVANPTNSHYAIEPSSANPHFGFEPSEASHGELKSEVADITTIAETKNVVTVYPNPASSFVNVRSEVAGAELTLINALGQTIIHTVADENETRLDLSNIAKGTYVLITKTEKESTNKIISVIK